jgi:hypothetical protein
MGRASEKVGRLGARLLPSVTRSPARTVRYALCIEDFIAARRWDRDCLRREPLLQAQAVPLDGPTLDLLRARFREVLPTRGWAGAEQYRFEEHDVKIMLWSGPSQCDWWISGTDALGLRNVIEKLMTTSDLRTSLWSNDELGEALLQEIRHTM